MIDIEQVRKNPKSIDWDDDYTYWDSLSEDFIREFKEYVCWEYVVVFQVLSEDFIEEFSDKVNWNDVSYYQKLSEQFISKFESKANWTFIAAYQRLSKNFIIQYWDKLDKFYLTNNSEIDEEIKDYIRLFC